MTIILIHSIDIDWIYQTIIVGMKSNLFPPFTMSFDKCEYPYTIKTSFLEVYQLTFFFDFLPTYFFKSSSHYQSYLCNTITRFFFSVATINSSIQTFLSTFLQINPTFLNSVLKWESLPLWSLPVHTIVLSISFI